MPEDLIGLKVQSSSNDPARLEKDMADIHEILQKHGKKLDWDLMADYFHIFDRDSEFWELKRRFG